jgi:predicted lipid-binding transport protein (Tim44 family)
MDELDDLLARARATQAAAPPALLDRVMADALAHQPAPRPLAPARAMPSGAAGGWLGRLFGTGGALAGLGGAMLAGLALGMVQPAPVLTLTDALLPGAAIESLDLIPDLSAALLSEE